MNNKILCPSQRIPEEPDLEFSETPVILTLRFCADIELEVNLPDVDRDDHLSDCVYEEDREAAVDWAMEKIRAAIQEACKGIKVKDLYDIEFWEE